MMTFDGQCCWSINIPYDRFIIPRSSFAPDKPHQLLILLELDPAVVRIGLDLAFELSSWLNNSISRGRSKSYFRN